VDMKCTDSIAGREWNGIDEAPSTQATMVLNGRITVMLPIGRSGATGAPTAGALLVSIDQPTLKIQLSMNAAAARSTNHVCCITSIR
jgi:hypothetical protein